MFLWKKVFLEISQNPQENICTVVSILKRDSGTGVFLWILRNFWEHLFYRTPLDDCFYFVQYLKNFVLVFRISRKQFQKQQSREVCCPVNLLHIFRTPFSRNTYEQLLLQFETEVLQNPLKKLVISVLNYHKFKKKNCFFHLKLVYGCLKIPNCIAHWDQRVCWNLRTASSNIS